MELKKFFCKIAPIKSGPVNPLQDETCAGFYRKVSAYGVAFGSVIIAGFISIIGYRIQKSTLEFFDLLLSVEVGRLDVVVTLFWTLSALWSVALFVRLNVEDKKSKHQLDQIKFAIHRVPNLDLVTRYPELIRGVKREYISVLENEEKRRLVRCREAVNIVLKRVCQIAELLSRVPEDVYYSANVMLVLKTGEKGEIDEVIRKSIKFHDPKSIDYLSGALYLKPELSYSDGVGRSYDEIALPIPSEFRDIQSERALPGAPTAVIDGFSIHENTRTIRSQCSDLESWKQDAIAEYFSADGRGATYRSFASYRIGTPDNPVGVVNIDSELRNILGADSQFYDTFTALITPLLQYLEQPVSDYSSLRTEKLEQGAGSEECENV